VINMGVGSATQDKKDLADASDAMGWIAGQKPVITKARKSVANFRLREGQAIGCKVTLRGDRMYEFMVAELAPKRLTATATIALA